MENSPQRFERMEFGALLDRTFRLYSQNIALMLGIVAVTLVPVTLLQVILAYVQSGSPDGGSGVVLIGYLVVMLLFGFVAYPIAQGATTFAISERYLGQEVSLGQALGYAMRRFWTLLNAAFTVGIRIFLGFLLLVVPGLIWSCMYFIVVPIVIVEGTRTREGLRRSRELTQGLKWKIFWVFIVLAVFNLVVAIGVSFVVMLFFDLETALGSIVYEAVNGVISIVITPLGVIAATLIYYDCRIRKEGFDLEMLGQSFGAMNQPVD